MIILGVTGSIGMGKSTVASMLSARGIPVHDADAAVHRLLGPGGEAVGIIGQLFPAALSVDSKGLASIDRAILGRLVFGDRALKKQLEDILHPLVRAESDAFVADSRKKGLEMVALDIPLLFETGGEKRVDVTICVSAPAADQQARVLARPGMTREKFERIVAGQLPDAEKRKRANYVLDTGQSLAKTEADLDAMLSDIRAKFKGPKPPDRPKGFWFGVLVLSLFSLPAMAATPDKILVELFTAQSCANIRASDELLAGLAKRADVAALAHHVDYCDIATTFAGRWQDPFSQREATERQRIYGEKLFAASQLQAGRMVIDGRYYVDGNDESAVLKAIEKARDQRRESKIDMTQTITADGVIEITLNGAPPAAMPLEVIAARYVDERIVTPNAGHNADKKLRDVHIARRLQTLGRWSGGKMTFRYPLYQLPQDESCHIVLQHAESLRVMGAATCLSRPA